MGQYSTKEYLSQTITQNIEPLKSWVESSVISLLEQQLLTITKEVGMSITYSKNSSDASSALSEAVSNLSSQIVQLQDMVVNGPGYRTKYSEDPFEYRPEPSEEVFEYSCGAVLGVEQAFAEDMCVFCGGCFTSSN